MTLVTAGTILWPGSCMFGFIAPTDPTFTVTSISPAFSNTSVTGKLSPFHEGAVQTDEHDMITTGFHYDLGIRRHIDPLDPPHTHHTVIHQVRVNFDALCRSPFAATRRSLDLPPFTTVR